MDTKRWAAGALALVGIGAAGCGTTIKPGQMGVKYLALSKGAAVQKEVKPEGYYPQWAWNDIVLRSSDPAAVLDARPQRVLPPRP